jgi:FMN phosphatase YigB (HAD superfamily)
MITPSKKKKKYIFAIDLHNVLFTYSFRQAIGLLATQLPWRPFLKMLLRPSFFWRLYTVSRTTRVLDDIFERVEKEYTGARALWPFGHKLANCQVPNKAVVALLEHVKQEGHTLILFSNIAPLSLLELKKAYRQVFALFDGEVTPCKQDGYAQKPQEAFFNRLIQLRSELALTDREIVVIDDRKTNCDQALKSGMLAIRFRSVQKLKEQLASSIYL